MYRLFKGTLIALGFSALFVSFAYAQSIPGITEPITFQVSPEFPAPNTEVTVSAQSFSTDLNRASFSWFVNGKSFKKGTGVTEITVPIATSAVNISVSVATADIGDISNSVSVRPGNVELIWQSDGYTPPFYAGKALEVYGSSFKVTAMPNISGTGGKKADPKTLVYTWKKNGTVDEAQSGYGKDSYTGTQSSYVRGGDTITVEVSTVSKNSGANGSVTISPTVPEILFYENSPLYGMLYEKSLQNNYNLSGEEITLRAEPFNISAVNLLSGSLTFDWTLNGTDVSDFKNKNEITLRTVGTAGGQSNVGLTVQHKTKVLQGGQVSISIFQ